MICPTKHFDQTESPTPMANKHLEEFQNKTIQELCKFLEEEGLDDEVLENMKGKNALDCNMSYWSQF